MARKAESPGLRIEIKVLRNYIVAASLFVFLSYSVYLVFSESTINNLGREDGFYENLTAMCFFAAALFFLLAYFSKRNIYFLLLFLLFFFGGGEEISWGQRIFNIKTPEYMAKINAQQEINIHNIYLIDLKEKTWTATILNKVTRIQFLYKVFWLMYCVLLPITVLRLKFVSSITQKIRLPVPPFTIGIFFLISWLIFKVTLSFLLPSGKTIQYYWSIGEIMECNSAFLFMILSIYFYKNKESINNVS